jgi:hypothetical protein
VTVESQILRALQAGRVLGFACVRRAGQCGETRAWRAVRTLEALKLVRRGQLGPRRTVFFLEGRNTWAN